MPLEVWILVATQQSTAPHTPNLISIPLYVLNMLQLPPPSGIIGEDRYCSLVLMHHTHVSYINSRSKTFI
jgi:hypothetical protein